MPDYESIDPAAYLARFDRVPRERYLLEHWRPLTEHAIARYCRGRRVLDLGCGFGDYTRAIPGECVVVGLDLSERWLRHARGSGLQNLVRADAHHVPLRGRTFDVVLSIGLLEYVDPAVVIGEVTRLLAPGGFCILVSSNRYSAFRMLLRLFLALRRRVYDCREISLGDLESTLRAHGIAPIEARMDDGLVWLPDWLDQRFGMRLYRWIEGLFQRLGRNPLSNEMLVVGRKRA